MAASNEQQRKKVAKARSEEVSDIPSWTDGIPLSPSWWAPVFVTLLLIGLLWLVVYYFSTYRFPIPGIGAWNLAIGIGFMLAGFIMTLRWR